MRYASVVIFFILFNAQAMDQSMPSPSSLLQSTPPEELPLESICLAPAIIVVAGTTIKLWTNYPDGIPTKPNEDKSPGRASPLKRSTEPEEILESHWYLAKYTISPDGSINQRDPIDSSSPISVESLSSRSTSSLPRSPSSLSQSSSSGRIFSFDREEK